RRMQYRRLGRAGVQVSALSFGSWVTFSNQLQVDNAKACMYAAYDAGVNFFDNAEAYARGRSEEIMGRVLADSGWRRDSFLVSSKVFFGSTEERKPNQTGLSRKHVIEACHQAMERLQVDYLDLYFCHRPDENTPIEETVRAMSDLITQGKVLYWGTSEWSAQQIMEAYAVARQYNLIPPTMEQPEYNMFHRRRVEEEYRRLYTQIGLGTTIWSPLYSGLLTGKYTEGVPEGSRLDLPGYEWLRERLLSEERKALLEAVPKLGAVAKDLGASMAQLALAWTIKNPNVSTAITGASRPAQVEENMRAVEVLEKLDESVMERIEEILSPLPEG
ncbi:MAG: potassium channel beta subunit family protein, partial [Spirochaetaceae bacterium]